MKKETILLKKYKLTRGYGSSERDISENEIWNKILEFFTNKNIKYLKHLIREEWIENKKYEPKILKKGDIGYPMGLKIPVGDNYVYLDIYYENKESELSILSKCCNSKVIPTGLSLNGTPNYICEKCGCNCDIKPY